MKKYLLISLIVLVLLAAIGAYVFFDIQKMSATGKEANDFLSCAKLQTSQIKERNPDTICTTKIGKSFIETPTFFK